MAAVMAQSEWRKLQSGVKSLVALHFVWLVNKNPLNALLESSNIQSFYNWILILSALLVSAPVLHLARSQGPPSRRGIDNT